MSNCTEEYGTAAEEEEEFASPSASEPVEDDDDDVPISAAAFGSPAVEQAQSPESPNETQSQSEDALLAAAIASIRNLLTARHGAAYTEAQYDAWARHIGLSTGGADYENPPLSHPLFGGAADILLDKFKSPGGGTPGRVKSLAQVVQARIDAERSRDGDAKKSELLEMLDEMLDGASIATSPSRSEAASLTPEAARSRRAAAVRAEARGVEVSGSNPGQAASPPTSKFMALVNRVQQNQPPPMQHQQVSLSLFSYIRAIRLTMCFLDSFRGTRRTRRFPTSLRPTTSTGTPPRTPHNSSSSSSSSNNSSDPTPATPAIYPNNRNNERRRNFSRSRRRLTRGSRTNSHRGKTDRRGATRAGVVTRRTRATMAAVDPTDARLRRGGRRRGARGKAPGRRM